jgi:SAM-dependent methyltransferase
MPVEAKQATAPAEQDSADARQDTGFVTATAARYDGLAEWYDEVMRDPSVRGALARAAYEMLVALLGPGSGLILDIGCGTGLAAERVQALGYQPVGIDLSLDQLRVASRRLPVVQGDAARLPVSSDSVAAAYSTFVSSDLDEFAGAVAEAHRVLRSRGRYVSICVHPCFNGGYATEHEDGGVSVRPGYAVAGYQSSGEFGSTIRSHVGAWHRPLGELINTFLDAGFRLTRIAEGGPSPLPGLLGIAVVKP